MTKQTDSIAHRGPDDYGTFLDKSLGFGFRRLSIIDLATGYQPVTSIDEKVTIMCNGEIYNFPELRKILEQKGHVFQTNSDTEVILHGYEQWGLDILGRLNGIFGLAIWDSEKRSLTIARDAMGVKLVYYQIKDGSLVFGSEIRAILAANPIQPSLSVEGMNAFLRYRYTPSPVTIYENINKLAPGTALTVSSTSDPTVFRWYENYPVPFAPMPKPREAEELLLEQYRAAVKRQLLSDVEIGLLLSGGVDSALLLGLMNEHRSSWKTYTVGYEGTKYNELKDAIETASLFGSQHTDIKLSIEDFEAYLPIAISYLEEPIASSSIVPVYCVCKAASKDLKVVICGQGPDELLGGYKRHLGIKLGKYWRMMPSPARKFLNSILQHVPRTEVLQRASYSLDNKEKLDRYQNAFSLLPGNEIAGLFKPDILPSNNTVSPPSLWVELMKYIPDADELSAIQFLEVRSSLPDELFLFGDKLSMCHGLEMRVPYIDKEVVEFVERLDSNYKVKGLTRKWLHKKVCASYLPKKIIQRPKLGFGVETINDWFRSSLSKRLIDTVKDSNSLVYQYLNQKSVMNLYEKHTLGKQDYHKPLYCIVALETFLRSKQSDFVSIAS
ncbi:Asparagine synthetase [glutamine-hydrolyzing] [Chitinispirillum alkaliphilum]|nr:Asparagine synthetase [glutamine-hydrolyzing] [Chitinispirillum alkaliphilum]